MQSLWKKIKSVIMKISLVDRLLMLFMLFLLLYTAFNLFSGAAAQDSNPVDIIVRTSAAAIFGYFVSGNFIKTDSSDTAPTVNISAKTESETAENENQIKNQIGFETSSFDNSDLEIGTASFEEYKAPASGYYNKIQMTIVTVIGILSLILLFIAGRLGDITPEISAAVSQLRDFVSACVGFLVSCGKAR